MVGIGLSFSKSVASIPRTGSEGKPWSLNGKYPVLPCWMIAQICQEGAQAELHARERLEVRKSGIRSNETDSNGIAHQSRNIVNVEG
jgi:hypothetical protein